LVQSSLKAARNKTTTVSRSTNTKKASAAIKAGMAASNESWDNIGIENPLDGDINSRMQLVDRGMSKQYLEKQIERSRGRLAEYQEDDLFALAEKERKILEELQGHLKLWDDNLTSRQRRYLTVEDITSPKMAFTAIDLVINEMQGARRVRSFWAAARKFDVINDKILLLTPDMNEGQLTEYSKRRNVVEELIKSRLL